MTKEIKVGNIYIGGTNPVTVQSMTNTKTEDKENTLKQICRLSEAGADLVRIAVPTVAAAGAVKYLVQNSPVPLIADIHYDYRLAIKCAENGISKIRINPGNISNKENLKKLVEVLKDRDIPVRIGINGGSLEKDIEKIYGNTAEALVISAIRNAGIFEELGFSKICLSVKSSDVLKTIEAYRLLSKKCDYPLHIGITETGILSKGIIKSSVGVGALLSEGIGDTVRISLTGDPVNEVETAVEILRCLQLREKGIEIISCPTCGRTEIDVKGISEKIYDECKKINKKLKIAVMGCCVNGIGEAGDADFGVAGGKKESIIFYKGNKIKTCPNDEILKELLNLVEISN